MKNILLCVIICFVCGCVENQDIQAKKGYVCIDAFTAIIPEEPNEIPLIVIFGKSQSLIDANILYFIRKDGTIFWSKTAWAGGPPYYRGQLSKAEMAKLRNELLFLKTINSYVKYIPARRIPPDYQFGAINIYDNELLTSVALVGRSELLGFYLPPDEEDKKMIEVLQGEKVLSSDLSEKYADRLWDHLVQILEKYVPTDGKKEDEMLFKIRYVYYSYPIHK